MKREPHITEFQTKKGSGLQVRVSTTRDGQKNSRTGGRFYYFDYSSKSACLRAARAERDRILAQIENTPDPALNGLTVGDLFERSFEVLPVAFSTQGVIRAVYDHAVSPLAGIRIQQLTLQQVQLSVNEYALTHTQPRTKKVIDVWKRIFHTAFYLQIQVVDYSRMIHLPKSRVPVVRRPRQTDLPTYQKFLEFLETQDSYYVSIIRDVSLVMYYTGMRIQEALALQVEDIDFEQATIRIQRSVGSTATETAQIVALKTEQSFRTLPIVPQLLPVLDRLVADAEHDLLFVDAKDRPININYLSRSVNYFANKAGLKFNLYSLRHLFSADLFRDKVNPKIIQSLMGHASADMSAYYAFTSEEERNKALLNRKPS